MIDYISFYSRHVEDLKREGKQFKGWCPFHPDRGSSLKGFSVNPSSGLWYCFGCRKGGNVFDFCREKGIPKEDAPGYEPRYRKYGYPDGAVKKRLLTRKSFSWAPSQGDKKIPYNVEAIDEARATGKRLWICEGEKDTETMHAAGELAIGAPSASDPGGIEKINFRAIKKITLAYDHDNAGREATEKILQIIPWADVIKWPADKKDGYDITDCYNEGGAEGFLETLTLWTEAPGVDIEPYTIDALREELQKIPMGLQTGWKDLDAYLTIQPGALTVIAGRPSHGKTTLMMNLALNMVRKYPDKSFFFFSYEEPRNKIAVKLITILGGYIIDAYQNTLQIERYIKGNNTGAGAIDSGISRYNSYASEKRLFVICNPYDVINLVNVITALNRRYNIGAIFIDYIQKIRPTEKAPSRQLEIQRISATLLETAVSLNIPMIVGAQVNREVADRKDLTDDKIREAGDIEQDANIILGVWSEGKENDPSEVDLYAKIIKNRDGQRDREVRLLFNKPILTITDATGG